MKLEVGKKYEDGRGNVIEIVYSKHGFYVGEWFCPSNKPSDNELDVYHEDGRMRNGDRDWCNLIKEYHEPRTWQEVMQELLDDFALFATHGGSVNLSLIKEAQQLLNKEKGE